MVASGWVGAAQGTAGAGLDDFLYAGQPRSERSESEAVLKAPATDAKPALVSNNCPYCAAHLSAVELKMERCLACGSNLHLGTGSGDGISESKPLTIGI
jgi:hypothetical protein